ncbi:SusC/RagA family TonB-linked outer membrane protein [Sphingobacterium sp. SG20118]|uniref:SusC/RagA family TonB-linked outer membrane protein n=1 Tax=Sphingobacterium sp. SG20118 TaxID=3367156 RepID=UPI0037DFC8DF
MRLERLYKLIPFLICMLLTIQLFAQTVTIDGKVVDTSGKPIAGVTIRYGQKVTSSNASGIFSLTAATGTNISFRMMGYDNVTVTIRNDKNLTVKLKDLNNQMDEVVVRGYVARARETATGASTKISGKDLQDVPAANIENLLQGKVPGLNIQVNTGAPGFRGSTQIRGLSTLSVSGSGDQSFLSPTSPLYVIDGVPMDADRASELGLSQQGPGISPLSLIPPEDVESIEVLKDAQATSLYGSLAAYGVIIITTKRGNSEVPRVRYTGNFTLKTPPKLRETLGGNLERRLKLQQIYGNAMSQFDIDRISQTYFLSDSLNAYYNNSTNWQDLYYASTYNQTHNVAIDGGNQKLNYKANLNYLTENGIIKNTGFDRYLANMRFEYHPNDRFKFIAQINGSLGTKSKGDGLGILQTGVADGGMTSTLLPGPSFYLASSSFNSALNTRNSNASKSIKPFIEASYEFLAGLRATTSFSYESTTDNEDTFTPAAANNQFAQVYSFNGQYNSLYNRNSITYSHSFKEKHNIFFNLFNEIRTLEKQSGATRQARTPNDQFEGPLGFDGYFSRGGGILKRGFGREKAISFALSGSYDYMKKYVIDLSYRMDGSSQNGFGNLFTKNPAVGLRWNAFHEEFIKDIDWINLLSIRTSWGINVMPNSTLERVYGKYDITGRYNDQIGIGINYEQIPNPNLKPTTTSQYNVGLDLGFFKNKLEVTYDTYYKKVDNLLFEEKLSTSLGFDKINSNTAAIANYGHELSVMVRPLTQGPLTMSVGFNGAYNQDVLLKLPNHYGGQFVRWEPSGRYLQMMVYRVGTPTMSNYMLLNRGVYSTDADVPVDPVTGRRYRMGNGTEFQAGDPIFADLDGNYILNDNDFARTGNSQPLFTGGMQFNLNYAHETIGTFGFNMYGSYTAKRTILNNALAERLGLMGDPFGTKATVPLEDIDMWRKPGDVAKYPYAFDYGRFGNIRPFRFDQDLWAEDGSYFKINNIAVSYMVTKKVAQRMGLERLRVHFSANNIMTFSKYSGPNPENVTSVGRDASAGYPVPREYTVGVNIDF